MAAAPRPLILRRASPLRRRFLRLYARLSMRFGRQGWWPAPTPFEVVVGAILTQNAAWTNAERAIARLRAVGALTPAAMGSLPASRLAALLRPSGTYRVKATRLRAFLGHLEQHHHGSLRQLLRRPVAELRGKLRSIPGIGPETADAIALYAANRPVFVVDAYTRRILARHRIVAPDVGYDTLQALFMANLPRDPALFNEYHALLVRLAKTHCRARPRCEGCPLGVARRGRPPAQARLTR